MLGNNTDLDNTIQWRHNGSDSVSNHQPHDCLLNRLFRRRSKKTSKLRFTGLCAGNSPGTGLVTRKMFPFDDVIMISFDVSRNVVIHCPCGLLGIPNTRWRFVAINAVIELRFCMHIIQCIVLLAIRNNSYFNTGAISLSRAFLLATKTTQHAFGPNSILSVKFIAMIHFI